MIETESLTQPRSSARAGRVKESRVDGSKVARQTDRMRAIALALVIASFAAPAFAQEEAARIVAPPPPAVGPTMATLSLTPPDGIGDLGPSDAERFATLRLGHREARNTEGIALLGYGGASIVAGALAAGIGSQDERWVGFGVGTAIWGAINAIFTLIFFDLDGHVLREIEQGRTLRGRELDRAREDWAASQYSTAATVAVNAGLDIFYIVGGILLFVIADQVNDLQWLEGYSIAMTAQGVGLLAFDLTTWIAAAQRGDAARSLFRDPEGQE